jgi:hypothetical protein
MNKKSNYLIPNYGDSRKERNQYFHNLIKNNFQDVNSIINMGSGGKNYLKKLKKNIKVIDVDISGEVDLKLNLEKKKIPFKKSSFDMSVALDTLEHLDNFHEVFEELMRVSKKYIIISLPNCFDVFFKVFFNKRTNDINQNGFYNKFYGIPINKPTDRHKWFFTVDDIERFFTLKSKENNYRVEFLFPKYKSIKSKILNLFLSKRLSKNILTKYCWIILTKK